MAEEKKLYPFRLEAFEDVYGWGVEKFALADLGYRDTPVRDGWVQGNSMGDMMETFLDRLVGDNVFDWYGQQFPFQLKWISCKGKMPLRVCPDDEVARQRYDALGKEKLWYVVSADADARVFLGLEKAMDVAGFVAACEDGSIASKLHSIHPKAGDFFHIAPGTPHCAFGKMEILELSESSAMDFCLCTWGQPREEDEFDEAFDLVEALDFIKLDAYVPEQQEHEHEKIVRRLLQLPQFTASLLNMTDPLHIYTEKFDSCIAYTCIKGAFELSTAAPEGLQTKDAGSGSQASAEVVKFRLQPGETVLVPAECPDFFLTPLAAGTLLLEAMVEKREDPDPYTGEDEHECHDDDCDCGHHHHHDHEKWLS